MKGWLALDVDGTLTEQVDQIPKEVIEALRGYEASGWKIAIVTGRSPAFARKALDVFPFPWTLIAQNGASAYEMPQAKRFFTQFLPLEILPVFHRICRGVSAGMVIYLDREEGNEARFCAKEFDEAHRAILETWNRRQKEHWVSVDSFEEISTPFPIAKMMAFPEDIDHLEAGLKSVSPLCSTTRLRDPFDDRFAILLVTAKKATKGQTLQAVLEEKGRGERVIAAGDDLNDLSLLDAADVKIAMPHAPAILREKADLIAPPTKENGIITALRKVIDENN